MPQQLLSGNEAIARGAWEAGCSYGFGYPGTPSTETLSTFSAFNDVYAEWSPNEKVALETAIGVSMAGARSLVTMKHVGLNVAADPLMTLAYTGVNGGLVILTADDPGMHSSQNEQDSRNYAHFARMPMFEPSDSADALNMTKAAFELSETYDTAFLVRSTTRISHTKNLVEVTNRTPHKNVPYEKNTTKWIMAPANARVMRKVHNERIEKLKEWSNECSFNVTEIRDSNIGVIASGSVYQHVREALPNASTLKIGVSYPLPEKKIDEFFNLCDDVYIVEEANDYFSTHIKAMGYTPSEFKNPLPTYSELSPRLIKHAFGFDTQDTITPFDGIPMRPPTLCPGCAHRMIFSEIKRLKPVITGDIGCYTLAGNPPLSAMDSTIDMGASVSMGHGFTLAQNGDDAKTVVSVIGDSTFTHSGITSLLSMVYNNSSGIVVILDNRTTAMTGGQGNPVNGMTLQGKKSRELDLVPFIKAMGVEDVVQVDGNSRRELRDALKNAKNNVDEISVIIAKAPCALVYGLNEEKFQSDKTTCRKCHTCVRIGCPAIGVDENSCAHIDLTQCVGCTHCAQVCPFDVIHRLSWFEERGFTKEGEKHAR